MIYQLRRKFILISAGSLFLVFAMIFALICVFNTVSVDRSTDLLTDAVAAGGGKFSEPSDPGTDVPDPPREDGEVPPPKKPDATDNIDKEARFSTRYFTVYYDASGALLRADTSAIHAVNEEEAVAYAAGALAGGRERGWSDRYRYKVYALDGGTAVTFVDGGMQRAQAKSFALGALGVLGGGCVLVTLLTVIFSGVAVKPAAESYEKQKRFITDASHELKTPLTLILTNVDIAESELGKSEWLDDIRTEGAGMSALIGQMVSLCRMDEERPALTATPFSFSDAVLDAVSEFEPLAEAKSKYLFTDIAPDVTVTGDEGALRRVLSILLDNAVKYCDPEGKIVVTLTGGHRPTLTVTNDYRDAASASPGRFFDRFYRADAARTSGSGFGIGLSIAKATVDAHHGKIEASAPDDRHIAFRVTLKG